MISRIGKSLAATAAPILAVVPAAEAGKPHAPTTSGLHGATAETVRSFAWRTVRRTAARVPVRNRGVR